MMYEKAESDNIPAILREIELLVPLKIDITYNGTRLVDTFCWNLRQDFITPDFFARKLCDDVGLFCGFRNKIALQIEEQLHSYREIVSLAKGYSHLIPQWSRKIREVQTITLGIRHGILDYTDKIEWDPMSDTLTPEQFAEITCADLSLPSHFKPAIAHKIRENLFRWLINIFQNPDSDNVSLLPEFKVSDIRVKVIQTKPKNEMAHNLWVRAKPSSLLDCAAVPQPLLPVMDTRSNAGAWLQPELFIQHQQEQQRKLEEQQMQKEQEQQIQHHRQMQLHQLQQLQAATAAATTASATTASATTAAATSAATAATAAISTTTAGAAATKPTTSGATTTAALTFSG